MGSGKVTFVSISPSSEILMSDGLKVTDFPKTILVGVPNSTVLISTLNGALPSSLLAKNNPTEVKNAPFISSILSFAPGASTLPPTVNDCASGSKNSATVVLVFLDIVVKLVVKLVFKLVTVCVVKLLVIAVTSFSHWLSVPSEL